VGNDRIDGVAKLIDQCNDYGLDTIEMGNALSVYLEARQRHYTNGAVKVDWGDAEGLVDLVTKTAYREGVGDVLAEGAARAAAAFGHPELSMTVKSQAIPAYDPRGLKGMGIAYATSNRGACHLRAYTPASELGLIPLKTDPLAWKGKGELTKLLQDIHAFSDSLDLCKFSAFAEGADEYAQQYAAVVGVPFAAEDVLTTGERIYNLERYYNNLAGIGEGTDTLPTRFTTEPSTMPGSEGHVCELDLMLEEYYAARGWVNGVVPASKLEQLGVE
jgi:aldehyde:ferredoxin oxidoreductase